MKIATPLFAFFAVVGSGTFAQSSRPDIILQYLGLTDLTFTIIGNSGNSVIDPSDLEFHTDLDNNELWVLCRGTSTAGGHVVVFSETGEVTQTSQNKSDDFKEIFMLRATGIAFNGDGNFATSSGAWDAYDDGGDPFTGPTLWAGDLTIFGEPGLGDGSHLDDLHQSPHGQGIAWQSDNIFWVNDGYLGEIVSYDFAADHGPGGFGSSDGIVHRYGGLGLQRDTDDVAVSHLAFDYSSNWLYVADYGNHRIIRLDVSTGTAGDTPFFGPFEPLAEYVYYEDFDWEVVVEDTTLNPSGIIVTGDKLLVSDHETGDIVVYLTSGTTPFSEWFRIVTADPGITGLEIGPDGRIFYTNETNNKVRRIDSPMLTLAEDVQSNESTSVYPNPAEDLAFIESTVDLNTAIITIFDSKGIVLNAKDLVDVIDAGTAQLTISSLAAGVYSIRIIGDNGASVSRLIVE